MSADCKALRALSGSSVRSRLVACLVVVGGALAACLGAAGVAAAGLPPEDECPLLGGIPGGAPSEDAVPTLVREGTMLGFSDLLLLRGLLPDEVWRNRDQFFHDGMRMLIGPCHRRYPAPRFYDHATQEFAGRSTIDRHGNLSGYVAGLPFPPDRIDPEAGDAGVRWAWNLEHRYRGRGRRAAFGSSTCLAAGAASSATRAPSSSPRRATERTCPRPAMRFPGRRTPSGSREGAF